MKEKEVRLYAFYRPTPEESIEERHAEITRNMRAFGPPLGWVNLPVPPAPDCGIELSAAYSMQYPIPGLRHIAFYSFRSAHHLTEDHASYDDTFTLSFKTNNRHLDYRAILHEHFPRVVQAFRAYRAVGFYSSHGHEYKNKHITDYEKVRADPSVNGRNNIFTLEPAMYWDALLCRRALGYGPKEVIRRLHGKVPLVMPLMDGVYIVFSDDPDLSFAEFAAINDRFKSILGLT